MTYATRSETQRRNRCEVTGLAHLIKVEVDKFWRDYRRTVSDEFRADKYWGSFAFSRLAPDTIEVKVVCRGSARVVLETKHLELVFPGHQVVTIGGDDYYDTTHRLVRRVS